MPSASDSAIASGTPMAMRNLTTVSCRSRDSFARLRPVGRQKNRSIGLAGDQPFALQPLDRAVGGDVRHAEPARQIGQPRFAGLVDQLRDHLDVVLRQLLGMILASAGGVPSDRDAARLRFVEGVSPASLDQNTRALTSALQRNVVFATF